MQRPEQAGHSGVCPSWERRRPKLPSALFHAAVQAGRRPTWGPPGCGGHGDRPCGPRLVLAPEGLMECALELRLTLREGLIFLF